MKKLFLASFTAYVIDHLVKFIDSPPMETTVAFITTAADPYEDKWFVEKDRKSLIDKDFQVTDIDIKNKTKDELYGLLRNFQIIFVSGGNVFYLLEKSLESGFDIVLPRLLSEGIIYVGSSAGSALVGPSLEPVKTLDDPKLGSKLKNHNGLNIVDFVILPHYGDQKYEERYKKIMDEYVNSDYKIIPLTNNQAVKVDGDKYEII